MAVTRKGDIVSFANPAGGCFFLDSDNLCRIEKEHGKKLKPGVCVLFPFNVFTRIGNTVVVSPHFMCPLRLQVPARPGEVQGTHSSIKAAIRESELLSNEATLDRTSGVLLPPSLDATSVIKREERFRDTCSRALGLETFRNTLRSQSEEHGTQDDFLPRAAGVMGLDGLSRSSARDYIDDLLLALAPPLRLSLLTLRSEAMLRALALAELILRQTTSLSPAPPTLQGAYQILTAVGGAIRLLARGNEPVERHRLSRLKSPQFGDPELTFAAFGFYRGLESGTGVLGLLERLIPRAMTLTDRSVLLNQLGSQIDGTPTKQRQRRHTASAEDLTTERSG
jgi:hypothetical protein